MGSGESACDALRWTCLQYMPSTRRDISRRLAGGSWLVGVEGGTGSALISSTWNPQSSMVSMTEEIRLLFSTRTAAELLRRLTTTSEMPGRRESISVMVAMQEEQVMPPTERVRLCGAVSDGGGCLC